MAQETVKDFITDEEMSQLESGGQATMPDFIPDAEAEKYGLAEPSPVAAPQEKPQGLFGQYLHSLGTGFADIGKGALGVGKFLTESPRKFGQSIGEGIMSNFPSVKEAQQKAISSAEEAYNTRDLLVKKQMELQQKGQDTSFLDGIISANEQAPQFDPKSIFPESAFKSTQQVLGEAGGTLADVLSAGTFSKYAKTGQLLGVGEKLADKLAWQQLVLGKTKWGTFLKGGIVAGIKASPVGALFGVTNAMQDDRDIQDVVKSGMWGGLIAFSLAGLLGGREAKKLYQGINAEQIKKEAIKRYMRGLSITKEKYKDDASKVIPELIKEGVYGTRGRIIRKAQNNVALSLEEYQTMGELKGLADTTGILGQIDKNLKGFLSPQGVPFSTTKGKYDALQKLRDDIVSLQVMDKFGNPQTFQQALREYAQTTGELLYEGRKSVKTLESSPVLSQTRKVDAAIRDFLSTKNPTYADINKLYHSNQTILDVIEETAKRETSGLGLNNFKDTISFIVGAAAGQGGVLQRLTSGVVLSSLIHMTHSTWYNTLRAVQQYRLAEKLSLLPFQEQSQIIQILGRESAKVVEPLLKQLGITD